jgi:DNA polymerase-3 subunit gamma/tau
VRRLPLARAHRPQTFAEVLGQDAAVRALGAAAERGDVASAYIFSGTRGIGKTTLARLFAKALNCAEGPARDCCGTCAACSEIAEGRSLDVVELDAATHTGIDDIRELREGAQYRPNRDRYRVFILDEAHQLSTSAWNGLLKILEEPPSWCVFVFCTTEPHKIPPTIESRALHFSFRSPAPALIREHLARIAAGEEVEIDDDALDLVVEAADGSVRDGLSALDQVRAVAEGRIDAATVRDALGLIARDAIESYARAVGAGDAGAALGVVAELDSEGQDLRAFTAETLRHVRDLAVARAAGGHEAPGLRVEQLVWLGRVLDETERRLRIGGAQRTLLDLATIRMCAMAGLPELGELVERLGSPGGAPPAGGGGSPRRERAGPRPSPRPSSPRPPQQSGPAGGGDSATPATPAPSSPPSAPRSPSGGPETGAGDLLGRLGEQLARLHPPLAAFLGRVRSARLEGKRLVLTVPAAKRPVWAERFDSERGRQTLAEALAALGVGELTEVTVECSASQGGSPGAHPSTRSRREVLEEARRDELVQKLFRRFGAILIDGHALDDSAPPGGATPDRRP